jgi:hypothetical protein
MPRLICVGGDLVAEIRDGDGGDPDTLISFVSTCCQATVGWEPREDALWCMECHKDITREQVVPGEEP